MRKKIISCILGAILMLSLFMPIGCANNTMLSINGYKISSQKTKDGYIIEIIKDGVQYSTSGGALGARFDKNSFRADEPIYAHYQSVSKTDGGIVASGTISSAYGTEIAFEDYYSVTSKGVNVDRVFTVAKKGEDLGFMTELKFVDKNKGTVLESDWFIPSTHYITGEHTFSDTSNRMYFSGQGFVVPSEDVSVLMVSRYKDGKYFCMTDTTQGFRENIIDDNDSNNTVLYIDARINMPGIIVNDDGNNVSISHIYPTYTNKKFETYIWRLLPVEEGLARTVSFNITIGKEDSYPKMLRATWRNAYDRFGYADKRYNIEDLYEVLIDAINRSYSKINAWGNIPMYMTNADHYFPDSGFLYRNLELATLMLKEGRARNNQKMIDDAWSVIYDQLYNDRLDTRITAYLPENSVYKRVLYDSLGAAVDLYVYEKNSGYGDSNFLNYLSQYIITKAEKYKNETSAMALNFYMPLYKNQDMLFVDYSDVALRILEKAYEDTKDYKGYYGGIESTNTLISVAEDYMILLRGFITAYEIDGQKKWLDKAIELGDYLETYQMIQPFQLNLIGATGAEGYNLAFIGNERFLAYGYIFNNTQHGILDTANNSSIIEFYKLYKYTNDTHYLDFAEAKLHNALLYVNMGDKVGHMDDLLHSAGKGFINEFVGNATFASGFKDGGIRGAAHDSNIAWNIWQIVSVFDWFRENAQNYIPSEMSQDLTHNLALNKYVLSSSHDNPIYGAQKVIDRDNDTYWKPTGDKSLVIDLNEFCDIKEIKVFAKSKGAVKVAFSNDNVDFTQESDLIFNNNIGSLVVNTTARYVKIISDVNLAEVEVLGIPCFYKTLSYEATIISYSGGGAPDKCLDESKYNTHWIAGATDQERELVIDLGDKHKIFQTAIKFNKIMDCAYKVEVSDDNVDYTTYAVSEGGVPKLVFVDSKYAEARYVKLTLISSSEDTFVVSDFKVMGK